MPQPLGSRPFSFLHTADDSKTKLCVFFYEPLRPRTHHRIHPLKNLSGSVSADRFYGVYNPADLFPRIFPPCDGFPADQIFEDMSSNLSAGIHPNGLIRWSVQTHRINPSEGIPRMHRNDSTHAWNSLYDSVAHVAAS